MSLLFIDGIGEHLVPATEQLLIEIVAVFARLSLESFFPVPRLEHLVLFVVLFTFGSQLLGVDLLAGGYLFCPFFILLYALVLGIKFRGGRFI